ncbi:3-oxoacyl-ACP reductase FabG [Lentisalinibacter orientalis]|uniref:3-oxoacyl-ACP reductase FabG n=1 Tax=Lentisalinibacter orientalis TaxID=2992241 RepID=UPI00386DE0C8
MNLVGKVALVTGGGRGIGRQIAVDLACAGAEVVVNYRASEIAAQETAAQVARQSGKKSGAMCVQADVRDSAQVDQMFRAVEQSLGTVDILVNNAGVTGPRMLFEDMSLSDFQRVLMDNLNGVYLCTQRALPGMKSKGLGRIINLSSSAARTGGNPGIAGYAAAKAAISSLTRTLAKELAAHGVTVNAVAPGVIATDMHANTSPDLMERLKAKIPVGRIGKPEDIGPAVALLASEGAAYITGEVLEINGGLVMD